MTSLRSLALGLAAALAASTLASAAEPVDSCATMLGSLSVELRHARNLPPGRDTNFNCPKRFRPLIGASRARILRSLGPPDARVGEVEGSEWKYVFARRIGEPAPGAPELVFHFDDAQQVSEVDCHRQR